MAVPPASAPAPARPATKVSLVFRPKSPVEAPPPKMAEPTVAPPPAPAQTEPVPPSDDAPAAEAEKAPASTAPVSPAASEAGAQAAGIPESESSVAAAHRLLVTARQGAAAAESQAAKRATEGTEPATGEKSETASEAVTKPSGWPALARAGAMVFRRSATALIILGLGYYGVRTWVLPLVKELPHPGKTDAIHDKAAPTAVRVVQQTRQVVAQNDARAEYLNSVVDLVDAKARQPAPTTPAPAAVAAPVATPVPVVLTADAYRSAVDRLKIAGVYAGDDPRINLDGRLVKYGEIVDREMGLRFIGIDPAEHVILFSNMENVTFKKIY